MHRKGYVVKLTVRNNTERTSRADSVHALDSLVFKMDEELYAIPVSEAVHVLQLKDAAVSRVSARYAALAGFLDWDGKTVPLLDLSRHLDLGGAAKTRRAEPPGPQAAAHGAVILVTLSHAQCALLVQSITNVRSIPRSSIARFPVEVSLVRRPFYSGSVLVDSEMVLFIDLDAVFPAQFQQYLSSAIEDFTRRVKVPT
jgi:chemotaxis signal transduction protein